MYSVILATMLTAGANAPDWHRHGCSSWGCYSGCYTSYCWGGCGSCGYIGHHHHWRCGCYGGYGCWGGCYGGCYSSCYSYASYGCGCYGGYYGCYGCYGCGYGCGCYGSFCHGSVDIVGYCGCTYGCGVAVTVPYSTPVYSAPSTMPAPPATPAPATPAPAAPPAPIPPKTSLTPATQTASVDLSDRAEIVVQLPAEAQLYVDQVKCPLTGEVRSFKTPALRNGAQYYYTLEVAMERNGQRITEQKRVLMTSGQRVEVDFRAFGGTINTDAIAAAK